MQIEQKPFFGIKLKFPTSHETWEYIEITSEYLSDHINCNWTQKESEEAGFLLCVYYRSFCDVRYFNFHG